MFKYLSFKIKVKFIRIYPCYMEKLQGLEDILKTLGFLAHTVIIGSISRNK
jgi:hypothetical protein